MNSLSNKVYAYMYVHVYSTIQTSNVTLLSGNVHACMY